jgi:hypothetical protein
MQCSHPNSGPHVYRVMFQCVVLDGVAFMWMLWKSVRLFKFVDVLRQHGVSLRFYFVEMYRSAKRVTITFPGRFFLKAVSMYVEWPIPVAARSKARVCCCSLPGIAGSIPAGAWMSVVNVRREGAWKKRRWVKDGRQLHDHVFRRYPVNRKLGGLSTCLDASEEKNLLHPLEVEPRFRGHPARNLYRICYPRPKIFP